MKRISGDSEADRRTATEELAKSGFQAIEHVLRHLPGESEDASWAALIDGLAGMGPAQASADLLSYRSDWPYGARKRLEGAIVDLRRRFAALIVVPLKAGELADSSLVPPEQEVAHGTDGPVDARFAPGGIRSVVLKGALHVDTAGTGRYDAVVNPGKPAVLLIGPKGAARPVAFRQRLGAWIATPARVFTGNLGKESVQVLDADGDGAITEADCLRIGETGAFRHLKTGNLFWSEEGLTHVSFRVAAGATILEAALELPPSWAGGTRRTTLDWLNRWRRGPGLPPVRLDRTRSEGCRLHAEYMSLNGVGHGEEEGKPGFTPEGREEGKVSSVGSFSDPAELLRHLESGILSRLTCIGSASEGVGVGHAANGSAVHAAKPAFSDRGGPVLVPGPGQSAVPRLCGRSESPKPDLDPDFFEKPRGYPVSVAFAHGMRGPKDVRMELFEGPKEKPVEGFLFTPEKPYATFPGLERNYHSAVFVARDPLLGRTSYTVRFSAICEGKEFPREWSFRTE